MESHFSLEHAIGMLKANDLTRLEEIHLIHLSSQNSNAKYIKREILKSDGRARLCWRFINDKQNNISWSFN